MEINRYEEHSMDQVKGPFMIKKMKLIVYSVCQSLINLPLPRGYFQLRVEMSPYSLYSREVEIKWPC